MRGAERLEVGEAPREGRGETPFEAGADMVDVVGEQYMCLLDTRRSCASSGWIAVDFQDDRFSVAR